jgi:protein arginine kinase
VGLTVRGSHGEGTKATGDVLQISNQHTLGRTEEELLGTVQAMVEKIVEYERGVRTHLLEKSRTRVEDKVMRSVGLLRYARRVSSDESLNLLSAVRLGVSTKLFGDIKIGDLNELLVLTQPGHLQALRGEETRSEDRDVLRAKLLRDRFKPESN